MKATKSCCTVKYKDESISNSLSFSGEVLSIELLGGNDNNNISISVKVQSWMASNSIISLDNDNISSSF